MLTVQQARIDAISAVCALASKPSASAVAIDARMRQGRMMKVGASAKSTHPKERDSPSCVSASASIGRQDMPRMSGTT